MSCHFILIYVILLLHLFGHLFEENDHRAPRDGRGLRRWLGVKYIHGSLSMLLNDVRISSLVFIQKSLKDGTLILNVLLYSFVIT